MKHPIIKEIQLGKSVEDVVEEHFADDHELQQDVDLVEVVREIVRLNNPDLVFAVSLDDRNCEIIVLNGESDLVLSYWDDDNGYALDDNAHEDCEVLNEIVVELFGKERIKPKTKLSSKEYAAKKGKSCPFCLGKKIISLDNENYKHEIMGCTRCGQIWNEKQKTIVTGFSR